MAVPLYRNDNNAANAEQNSGDSMRLLAGVSLMVFGAGLVMTNPAVRRALSRVNLRGVATVAQVILPDVERYFRLRST